MVFDKLRESTKEQHLNIKNGKYANKIMKGELSLFEYQMLIIANYFFHGTIERQLFGQVPKFFLKAIDFESRKKLKYILRDLIQLGLAPNKLLSKNALKKLPTLTLDTEAKALAALYVAEGTAIGGAIIKKQLLKHKNLKHLNFLFYGCYGKELSYKWKSFAKHFNERCEERGIGDEVINSTQCVFDYYEQLLAFFESYLTEKKMQKNLNKNPMIYNLLSESKDTEVVVLTWDKLPSKKEFSSDITNLNSLLVNGKNHHVLMNFLTLGNSSSKKIELMWEITNLLETLQYKEVKKIGVTIPEKTTGKVMVKQMLNEVVENEHIDVGFFDSLQECTIWSTE